MKKFLLIGNLGNTQGFFGDLALLLKSTDAHDLGNVSFAHMFCTPEICGQIGRHPGASRLLRHMLGGTGHNTTCILDLDKDKIENIADLSIVAAVRRMQDFPGLVTDQGFAAVLLGVPSGHVCPAETVEEIKIIVDAGGVVLFPDYPGLFAPDFSAIDPESLRFAADVIFYEGKGAQ